jgi:hypothetical protein
MENQSGDGDVLFCAPPALFSAGGITSEAALEKPVRSAVAAPYFIRD